MSFDRKAYMKAYNQTPKARAAQKKRNDARYADPAGRLASIEYSSKRARATLDRIDSLKVAAGCVDCRYDAHPQALHFDHIPERGPKHHDIALMQTYAWERIAAEMAKCEVVCANCHAIRTAERRAM